MFCPNCGKELSAGSKRCPICGNRTGRNSLWRLLVVLLVVVGLGAAGTVVGYRQYRFSQLKNKLETAVGTDAGYTETILKIEADSSNITYGEVFALCDKSVEDRQKLIIELRGLYPELRYDLKDRLIDFLNAENELVRGKRSFYRQQMQLSSAMDLLVEHVQDRPTSEYGWDYYRTRVQKLRRDAKEKAAEMVTTADGFLTAYRKTAGQEEALAREMTDEGLRFVEVFKKYQQSHLTKASEAKESAVKLQKDLAS